jgi:5-methylcytosine-specific restriction protein A
MQTARREADSRRGNSAERGYGAQWRIARVHFLRNHPLCMGDACAGLLMPATVVDHITPHRGDVRLFWDRTNWQALCKPCHDRKTAREDGGFGRSPTYRTAR